MKIAELNTPVRINQISQNVNILNPSPYLSDREKIQKYLKNLSVPYDLLSNLTAGHDGGIFNGPKFSRHYVDSDKYGVRFLGSTDILESDISNAPLLRRKDAESARLSHLKLNKGMTLVSCSGTVGRMAYVRDEMADSWSSQDVMKIAPNPERIQSGYLYTFLRSRYGIPLVTGDASGSIIQHLEPHQLKDLAIPRFSPTIEKQLHDMTEEAARLRSSANQVLREISAIFEKMVNPEEKCDISFTVAASALNKRLDAHFHHPRSSSIRQAIAAKPHVRLGDISKIWLPGIFKRIYTETPHLGAPFYTGSALYRVDPDSKGILSKHASLFKQVVIRKGMILIQAYGQEGGLVGKPVWIGARLDGGATTQMLARVECNQPNHAALMFAFLRSSVAYKQIIATPFGGSIPHFDAAGLSEVLMPILEPETEAVAARSAADAIEWRDRADELEDEAMALLEQAIREAAR